MNNATNPKSSPWRYFWLIALLALPALGWYGVLDEFSSRDINQSISNAGLIYGSARGINALVSLLQGTEFNIPFLTFSIGEVLDPINDLIERFSDVILVALGSLALQKILLAIVSQSMFNFVLTAIAIVTGVTIFLDSPKLHSTLLRTFLLVAFFRFSLGLVVLANSWVDATFLNEADQQRLQAMDEFKGELRQIDTLSKRTEEAAGQFQDAQDALRNLEQRLNEINQEIETVNVAIQSSENRLQVLADTAGSICGLSVHTPIISPTCPESVKKLFTALGDLGANRSALQAARTGIEAEIEDMREELTCLDNRQRGDTCHFWEVLPDTPNVGILQSKMKDIESRVSEFAENTINLLVSLLLKTIAIPLLFIYLLLKIVRVNWGRI